MLMEGRRGHKGRRSSSTYNREVNMENKVWDILTEAEDYNQGVEEDETLKIEKSAVLFGDESSVDSMALVNIILNFEDNLNDEFETDISSLMIML